jgi:hypothetical protein
MSGEARFMLTLIWLLLVANTLMLASHIQGAR